MRQVQNCLECLAESHSRDLVDHQCQHDWNGKTRNHTIQAQRNRVVDRRAALERAKKPFEVLEDWVNPGATHDA